MKEKVLMRSSERSWIMPSVLTMLVFVIFYAVLQTQNRGMTLAQWLTGSWNAETGFEHAWAVPVLFIVFVKMAWEPMTKEPVKGSPLGLCLVVFGVLLYVVSSRTIQPRLAFIGLPFLIIGSIYYVYGRKVARHMLFPAFFWYFAIPVPGIQHATNALQIVVTKSCYLVGTACGMQLINAGNEIRSATDSWNSLNIAEGCSGIRSLMALVMISAIYAYFTQKKVWKMALLFACALPLALIANFFRIFTIIVLAELGFSNFAAGAYHDWAGLLFFFPIALAGLFVIDRLLNWKTHRKKTRKVIRKTTG